jgi:hypothetical protein
MFIVDVQNIQTSLDMKANTMLATRTDLSVGFLSGRLSRTFLLMPIHI